MRIGRMRVYCRKAILSAMPPSANTHMQKSPALLPVRGLLYILMSESVDHSGDIALDFRNIQNADLIVAVGVGSFN